MSHKQQLEQAIEQMAVFVSKEIREKIFRSYKVAVVFGLVMPYFIYLKLSTEYKRQRPPS